MGIIKNKKRHMQTMKYLIGALVVLTNKTSAVKLQQEASVEELKATLKKFDEKALEILDNYTETVIADKKRIERELHDCLHSLKDDIETTKYVLSTDKVDFSKVNPW